MNKMMKRAFSLVLVLVLAFSMTACASKDDKAADNAQTSGGETAGNKVFKIGGIGPTTGGASIYGLAVKNAAELAVKEINANGGINGYQVELNFQDDEHDAEKAVNAYNTLKDWGMQILVGTVTSTPCVAVVEKTHADNVFQISPSASSTDSIKYDNAFRVCFSDPNQGLGAAGCIKDRGLGSKVAVIYDSSDVYSTGVYESFAGAAGANGIEIVCAEAFTSESNKDFTVQLQKAKESGAELLFLPIYYTEASLILAQAATMNYAPKIFGCDGLDGLLAVENFDLSLAEGVMFMTPFILTSSDERNQKFVADFNAAYGEDPNQFSADTYDALYIVKAVIEAANVTPDMSASDITEAIKPMMTSISYDGLTGTGMTWGADGEPNKTPNVVIIENGSYEEMK